MEKIQGKVIKVLEIQSGESKTSGKMWRRQEIVIETLDLQFPKKICFSLMNDSIDQFSVEEGEDLTVTVLVSSREYNGRWYTEVRALNIEKGILPIGQ